MTDRQKLINRARKVLALVSSPVAGEAVAAASLLKQLLDNHNMTLQELGLSDLLNKNLHRIIARGASANTKTCNPKNITTSHEGSLKTDSNQIKEVVYKHHITEMDVWFLCVLVKIAHAYEVLIIGDRYGTWADKSHYLKIVGFLENIKNVKSAIVNIRHFIENQISIRGYTEKAQIANYAMGLADTITLRITEETDRRYTYISRLLSRSKALKLSEYLYRCYGLTTDCDDPIDLGRDDDAYKAGRYDGHHYFKPNSCKEALSAALKNRAETAMEKLG